MNERYAAPKKMSDIIGAICELATHPPKLWTSCNAALGDKYGTLLNVACSTFTDTATAPELVEAEPLLFDIINKIRTSYTGEERNEGVGHLLTIYGSLGIGAIQKKDMELAKLVSDRADMLRQGIDLGPGSMLSDRFQYLKAMAYGTDDIPHGYR